ncbi:MAG: helix-turn-helix transcriptional regulator [Bdellovibrio sp.]|nr:helix-turn-helix transcriptional regulator [Bdellovibrio sp.]
MLDIYLTMDITLHPKLKDVTFEQVLKALGDPVRISAIKQLLAMDGEEKVCGTFDYSVTKATFSHHLKILREAGLIRFREEGTRRYISLRMAEVKKRFPGLMEMLEKDL